jgi:hypothetical protein
LYQSLFSFQDARERERRWGPLSHSSVLVMQKGATEDFGLWLMEVPGGMEGGINYNTDLFQPATAAIFRERFLAVLRRVADSPDIKVREMIVAPGEDKAAFQAWIQAARGRVESVSGPGSTAALPVAAQLPPAGLDEAAAELAAIWASLLGIDVQQIHADDNFFDLGGNSLLVMQAVEMMQRELNYAVDPRRYIHETLGTLSRARPLANADVALATPPTDGPTARSGLRRFLDRLGGKA